MSFDDKIHNLIIKLNRLTSQEQINWKVDDPPRSIVRGTDDHIPFFAHCEYMGKHFAIYQHRYQSFDINIEKTYWSENIILVILDESDRVLWEERNQAYLLFDLLETVRRKVSNIDGVLNDLLREEEGADTLKAR